MPAAVLESVTVRSYYTADLVAKETSRSAGGPHVLPSRSDVFHIGCADFQ